MPAARPSRSAHRASSSPRRAAGSRDRRGCARAIAMRWRWPPESFTPRSPSDAFRPSGTCSTNSSALAISSASSHFILGRIGASVAHVVDDARREDDGILRDDGHAPAQFARIGLTRVHAVDANAPRRRIVEAQQQLENRGLARARRAHESHHLAGLDAKREAIEGGSVGTRRIVERHVLERDAALRGHGHRDGTFGRANARLGRQQFEKALRGARCALDLAIDLREHEGRVGHDHGEEDERREAAVESRPSNTSWAPTQRSKPTAPNASTITAAMSRAR